MNATDAEPLIGQEAYLQNMSTCIFFFCKNENMVDSKITKRNRNNLKMMQVFH